jgi:hypothetical protein
LSKRPDCIAFVYGDQDQKRKLLVLAQQAELSASALVCALIEARYLERFGETPPQALLQDQVS